MPPTHKGFGMKIVTASVQQRGGTVSFDWKPEGLACMIALTYGAAEVEEAPQRPAAQNLKLVPRPASAPRILLGEDEPLVGMLVRDLLEEMGYAVTGPVARLDEA